LNPELLENLFLKYPGVKFDLFHIGYPYWGVTAALAKIYPNVFIDRLRWSVWTLFEARPASISLAELYWMYSLFTSLVGLCNMFLPGTNIRSLGIISRQRPLQFSKTSVHTLRQFVVLLPQGRT